MLILKRKHQTNNLVKISNTNTRKITQYKNCPKGTSNRKSKQEAQSTAEVQNKCSILIKIITNNDDAQNRKDGTKASEKGTEAMIVNKNAEEKPGRKTQVGVVRIE